MSDTRLTKFLETDKLDGNSQRLVNSYFSLNILMRATMLLSSTFYILFIIELVDFKDAAILVSIGFIVQAIIDYPSGVLGDLLGHKWVLFLAYLAHAVAYLMLGLIQFLTFDNYFNYLMIVFIFESFALAQESGALQSWFDNNYKISIGTQDANRETYRVIYGKTLMIIRFVGGLGIFVGGWMSNITGNRETVFILQAAFMITIAVLFLFSMKEYGERKTAEISIRGYLHSLFMGVKFVLRDKTVFYFFLSFVVIIVTGYIWVSLLIFPIYFGYTGSDVVASTLRTSLFLTGAILTGVGTKLSKKLEAKKWLPITYVLYGGGFYGSYVLILNFFPLDPDLGLASFDLIPLTFVFIAAALGSLVSTLAMLLVQRVMVDIIPDENRNSFYSLAPTIALLLTAIILPYVGRFLNDSKDFSLTILLFMVFPILVSGIFSYLSMNSYQPSEVTKESHHHPIFPEDSLFVNLKNAFRIALPPELTKEKDISAIWEDFIEEVTDHVNENQDIHAFLDQVLKNIYTYNDAYKEALEVGSLTYGSHQRLSILRKELFHDIEESVDKYKLSNTERALLKRFMRVLHIKEHQLAGIEVPNGVVEKY